MGGESWGTEKHGKYSEAKIPDISFEGVTRHSLVLSILGKTSANKVITQLNDTAAVKEDVGALESCMKESP